MKVRSEDYIREIVTIFFVQKRIIFGVTFLISIFAVLVAFYWPPIYAVEGSILIKGKKMEKRPEALEEAQLRMFELTKEDLVTEMEILKSPDVIMNTIQGLRGSGIFAEKAMIRTTSLQTQNAEASPAVDGAMKNLILEIRDSLATDIVPNSNIIQVKLVSHTPESSRIVLEELMNQYVRYRSNIYNPTKAEGFFEDQTEKFNDGLREKEKELNRLVSKSGSADPAKEIENNLILKKDLEHQLNLSRNERVAKKRFVENLERSLGSSDIQFFSFIENLSINKFGEKLQELVVERGNLLRTFHPESLKVERVTEQIENTHRLLKREVENYLANQRTQLTVLEETVSSIETQLQNIAKESIKMYGQLLASQRIMREFDLLKHSYDTFFTRLEEAKINKSSDVENLFSVSIASKPFFSGDPVFPRKRTLIPVGILAGLITGFGLGFLREFFDHSFKRPEDISKVLELTPLFSIPLYQK